jgi:glucose/arabinose dehydrogenase
MDHPEDSYTPSRRRLLALAATGTVGLAGCTGDGSDGDDGWSDDGDGGDGGGGDGSDGGGGTTDGPGGSGGGYDLATDHDIESWDDYDPEWSAPTDSPLSTELETEVLVENLEIPWDISFGTEGRMFFTERVGRVRSFDGEEVATVAEPGDAIDAESVDPGTEKQKWWVKGGEGGTLGIETHPEYPDPPVVYVYYTYRTGDGVANKVVRFDATAENPGETAETLVEGIPGDNYHNGGRLEFGPRNYLWIATGDGGQPEGAADPSSLGGKILRITPTGDPAPDNPDLGSDADPRVFTYGHRNPQGIVWLPDGTPLINEHGPNGRDEINRLEAGAFYGWPDVRNREEYLDSDVHRPLANSGPSPSWAPSGALFYTGDAVPALRYRMLTGCLISQQVLATTVTRPDGQLPPAGDAIARFDHEWTDDAYTATVHSLFKDEFGRIRHVDQAPDGSLYIITCNRDGRSPDEQFPTETDDRLIRVRPA